MILPTVFSLAGRLEKSALQGIIAGADGYDKVITWEQDHVPQHQDIIQFRTARDR
jgi:hypothetical protein